MSEPSPSSHSCCQRQLQGCSWGFRSPGSLFGVTRGVEKAEGEQEVEENGTISEVCLEGRSWDFGGVCGSLLRGLSGNPFADGRRVLLVLPAGRTGMSWESCPMLQAGLGAYAHGVLGGAFGIGLAGAGACRSAKSQHVAMGERCGGQPRMQRGDSAWKAVGQAEGARSSPCLATAGWRTSLS